MQYFEELIKNNIEISLLIRELRIEKGISQRKLYAGICSKKTYMRLEDGEGIADEWMAECLLSRLHVQYRLLEIVLSDEDFWQKECRYEMDKCIRKGRIGKAKELLAEYEQKVENTVLHKQYILWKKAELLKKENADGAGEIAREALELTLPISEVAKRLNGAIVLSEMELELYFLYRSCKKKFTLEEYKDVLEKMQEAFIKEHICLRCYFEIAYEYAKLLFDREYYTECREFSNQRILELRKGNRTDYLIEMYFISALAGMKLADSEEKQRSLLQEMKAAYYGAMAFGQAELANGIKEYCQEEFGWHIID